MIGLHILTGPTVCCCMPAMGYSCFMAANQIGRQGGHLLLGLQTVSGPALSCPTYGTVAYLCQAVSDVIGWLVLRTP
jgi:hypothetical protein